MNYSSDQPLTADPDFPAPQGALPVWTKVFTRPGEQTFIEITGHPEAKAKSAYIWVFLVGTISGLISSLTQVLLTMAGLQQAIPEFEQVSGLSAIFGTAGLLGAICFAPVTGAFSVAGFAFGTAIVHAAAKFFGGEGNFEKLAYAFGAITVPFTLISALTVPLNAIPFVGLCTLPLLLLLTGYILFLEMAAIKAVHRFGWGESAAALFLPTILLTLLCALIFVGVISLAGLSFNELFQQLEQGF